MSRNPTRTSAVALALTAVTTVLSVLLMLADDLDNADTYAGLLQRAESETDLVPYLALGAGVNSSGGRLVIWRLWRQNGAMATIQIKNVPEATHAVLRQRAAAAHMSMQEYLLSRLIEEGSRPTLDEVLDRAGGRAGGSVPLADAVTALRSERAGR